MRVLSLFSGIGGLDLGLEWAGMETAAQCEIDASCRFWLEQHWPGLQRWPDVREVTRDAVEAACGAIDVVAGGPPCQPASVAGRRQGSADVRWLWPEFLRVCREVSPRWIVAENPLGLASLEPHGLDWVCGELEGAGYEVWPVVVGADDVGAPHRRKRVWIVAHAADRAGVGGEPRTTVRGLSAADGGSPLAHTGRGRGDGRAFGAGAIEAGAAVAQSGSALAHGDGRGQPVERRGGLLDGERAASGDDADRRGERPVGESAGWGLALSGESDAGALTAAPPFRWPARPGEPQWEWEAPRLAHSERSRRHGRQASAEGQHDYGAAAGRVESECRPSDGDRRSGRPAAREPESRLGVAVDGTSDFVAGHITTAHRREALKALGNAVVPQVAEVIGRAIMAVEAHA